MNPTNNTPQEFTSIGKRAAPFEDDINPRDSKRAATPKREQLIENPALDNNGLDLLRNTIDFKLLEQIVKNWSRFYQAIQEDKQLPEDQWSTIFQDTNNNIKQLTNLENLSLSLSATTTSSLLEEFSYHNSQVALIYLLFKNTVELYKMHRFWAPVQKDKKSHQLLDFYKLYLEVLEACVEYLRLLEKVYLAQQSLVTQDNLKKIFDFHGQLDKMVEIFHQVWDEISERLKLRNYWIKTLPTLPQFSKALKVKGNSYSFLLINVQEAYKKLDESLEKDVCRLYCVEQEFTQSRKNYYKDTYRNNGRLQDSLKGTKKNKEEAEKQLKKQQKLSEILENAKEQHPDDLTAIEKAVYTHYDKEHEEKISRLEQGKQSFRCQEDIITTVQAKLASRLAFLQERKLTNKIEELNHIKEALQSKVSEHNLLIACYRKYQNYRSQNKPSNALTQILNISNNSDSQKEPVLGLDELLQALSERIKKNKFLKKQEVIDNTQSQYDQFREELSRELLKLKNSNDLNEAFNKLQSEFEENMANLKEEIENADSQIQQEDIQHQLNMDHDQEKCIKILTTKHEEVQKYFKVCEQKIEQQGIPSESLLVGLVGRLRHDFDSVLNSKGGAHKATLIRSFQNLNIEEASSSAQDNQLSYFFPNPSDIKDTSHLKRQDKLENKSYDSDGSTESVEIIIKPTFYP